MKRKRKGKGQKMRIKETISADEVGTLEDILPEFRQSHRQKRRKVMRKHEGSEG